MKIIAVSHQKGGVGKTSLTVNLALCYAYDLKVGVIDTDLQGSLQGISKLIKGVDVLPFEQYQGCLLYTSPSPRDRTRSRMPSSA